MGAVGLSVQIYVERKELKETYDDLKEKSKKVKDKVKENSK